MGQKVNSSIFRIKYYPIYKNKWIYNKTNNLLDKLYLKLYLYLNKNNGLTIDYSNINIINNKQIEILIMQLPSKFLKDSFVFNSINSTHYNIKYYLFILNKCIQIIDILKNIININLKITPINLLFPYFSPLFLNSYIKIQIKKNISIKKIFKQIYILYLKNNSIKNYIKLKGIKILISGKIQGILRAYSECLNIGKYSLHSINTKVKFYSSFIRTYFGLLGIKVWVFF